MVESCCVSLIQVKLRNGCSFSWQTVSAMMRVSIEFSLCPRALIQQGHWEQLRVCDHNVLIELQISSLTEFVFSSVVMSFTLSMFISLTCLRQHIFKMNQLEMFKFHLKTYTRSLMDEIKIIYCTWSRKENKPMDAVRCFGCVSKWWKKYSDPFLTVNKSTNTTLKIFHYK